MRTVISVCGFGRIWFALVANECGCLMSESHIVMGKITSPYGVKGWVKVLSFTDPMENILSYSDWILKKDGRSTPVKVFAGKGHGKGLVVQLDGCVERNAAESVCGSEILVSRNQLPELPKDEFYWHQLEGLRVFQENSGSLFGVVHHMMETGSNDVLVVRATPDSIDRRERLIPYLPDQVVKMVDLTNQRLIVDWDIEF